MYKELDLTSINENERRRSMKVNRTNEERVFRVDDSILPDFADPPDEPIQRRETDM